jgi:integrating conjugative element membrane protein (TIGR03747 family)
MTASTVSARAETTRQPSNSGILAKTLGLAVGAVIWIIVALIASIVMEWIGMWYFWPELGASHSQTMLFEELDYLSGPLERNMFTDSTVTYVAQFTGQLTYYVLDHTGIRLLTERFIGTNPVIAEYYQAAINTIEVFAVRLAILTLSAPVFVLFGMVAVTDGLVQRDLRRWGGGRESSYLYHRAKHWVIPTATISASLYLSAPITVNPAYIIVPCAAFSAMLLRIMMATMKKYL